MQIEINENAVDQVVTVNGKIFKVTRLSEEIQWSCCNCEHVNFDDDDYIEDNFVKCRNCNEEYGIDLDENKDIIRIVSRELYKLYEPEGEE